MPSLPQYYNHYYGYYYSEYYADIFSGKALRKKVESEAFEEKVSGGDSSVLDPFKGISSVRSSDSAEGSGSGDDDDDESSSGSGDGSK